MGKVHMMLESSKAGESSKDQGQAKSEKSDAAAKSSSAAAQSSSKPQAPEREPARKRMPLPSSKTWDQLVAKASAAETTAAAESKPPGGEKECKSFAMAHAASKAADDASLFNEDCFCGPDLLRPREEPVAGESWCLPVLRTEALLRLGGDYIGATQSFFDAGKVAPEHLDVKVECKALEAHGLEATEENLDLYREAARSLSVDARREIFFLRANDRLFRPCAQHLGKELRGSVNVLPPDAALPLEPVQLQDILASCPTALVMASTSS